jgi:hypothetical protein
MISFMLVIVETGGEFLEKTSGIFVQSQRSLLKSTF